MKFFFGKRGVYSYWKFNKVLLGGNIEKRGGGIFLLEKNNLTISNSVFIFNGFVKDGGGIYLNNCTNIIHVDVQLMIHMTQRRIYFFISDDF